MIAEKNGPDPFAEAVLPLLKLKMVVQTGGRGRSHFRSLRGKWDCSPPAPNCPARGPIDQWPAHTAADRRSLWESAAPPIRNPKSEIRSPQSTPDCAAVRNIRLFLRERTKVRKQRWPIGGNLWAWMPCPAGA